MKRSAKARHACRRCPFFAPPNRCRDTTIRSGRCGDWVWYVRNGKQHRRRYVRPQDPHTLPQMLNRAHFKAASRSYSRRLTEQEQDACIAAAAKRRTRPRLNQSGLLTGHQYWVRKDIAHYKMSVKTQKTRFASQVPHPHPLTRSSSGTHRGLSVVSPDPHRPAPRRGTHSMASGTRTKDRRAAQLRQIQRLTTSARKHYRSAVGAKPWRPPRRRGWPKLRLHSRTTTG